MTTTIADLELGLRTQRKLFAKNIHPKDSIDKLHGKKGTLTKERLVTLWGDKAAEDIIEGLALAGRSIK